MSVPGDSDMEDSDGTELESDLLLVVLAVVTLAIYILFLKPTGGDANNNNNAANENAGRQRLRGAGGGGRRPLPRQQMPTQQQQAVRRRLKMSDNAVEVLENCRSLPPHLISSANDNRAIGGFDILSENGLVAFSQTRAAAESSVASTPKGSGVKEDAIDLTSPSKDDAKMASLLKRKERAKILSRLFACTKSDSTSKSVPAPPAKGSTSVIGISKEKHLSNNEQRASLLRALLGLSAHYTVLVVVSLAPSNTSSYEATQKLHSEAIHLLRTDDGSEEAGISESLLPSHRVLLAGSAKGRVALVRQLSTNIGLTVDYDAEVQEELGRFGYEVSIINDWKSILPARGVAAS